MSAAGEKVAQRLKFLMTHGFEPDGELYARVGEVNKPVRAHGAEYVAAKDYDALLTQRDALEAREKVLREALLGIEVIEHGSEENGTKEVWFLLRSDGKKIGAGSVHLTGEFAKAMSLWAAKRRAALSPGEPQS